MAAECAPESPELSTSVHKYHRNRGQLLLPCGVIPMQSAQVPPQQKPASTALCSHPNAVYRSTGKVWQAVNIGKAHGIPNSLIISGAVHGRIS